MAGSVFGQRIDVHSGGVDLRFPHHDNEIAQSEAAYEQNDWVKYFWHSGHLTIEGCKMSKSLKNFLTIKETLSKYSFRQIRILFLLHAWSSTLDFSDDTMDRARHYEKIFNEFFMYLNDLGRENPLSQSQTHIKWTTTDHELAKQLNDVKVAVHTALCDSFDTPTVMESLKSLLAHTNSYINDKNQSTKNVILLRRIGEYIEKMFKIFGLSKDTDNFSVSAISSAGGVNVEDKETIVMPILKALVNFRERTRELAIKHKREYPLIGICAYVTIVDGLLTECDKLRDVDLLEHGVKLEDRDGKTTVKLMDPEVLKLEKLRLEKEESEKSVKEEAKRLQMNELKAKRDEAKKIPPEKLFTSQTNKYSKFDGEGFPLLDSNGETLSKSETKKLRKIFEAHKKKHNEWIASQIQD